MASRKSFETTTCSGEIAALACETLCTQYEEGIATFTPRKYKQFKTASKVIRKDIAAGTRRRGIEISFNTGEDAWANKRIRQEREEQTNLFNPLG
jgi:hypothetical protein